MNNQIIGQERHKRSQKEKRQKLQQDLMQATHIPDQQLHGLIIIQSRQKNSKVFVLGPSHHEYIAGCGLSSSSSCSTPFGDIPIDTEIINELKATGKFKMLSLHTDEQEHSLEMHFPFIHKQFSKMPFSMIPIMVGQVDSAAQEEYLSLIHI
eukprot:TRINITY_DN3446_c0_g1_i1.p1 TRINITY_DN3446_c0_g1~~TRINITY_DN3446_c0_g1_i1.p1  ORF type:complete len:152 (-),score=9.80 TRINITY_DN3446_c0_g1_i1:154-609(-)